MAAPCHAGHDGAMAARQLERDCMIEMKEQDSSVLLTL